ncbi:EutP/PduV family microcompartment system protein [Desemzia sp. C1]|uniref:EutP/PduV family microcompartment system protein n=1 Tax=Desemzia sp. C1 TaxID=2892016 RepID=UPI001E3122BE|nr:EutP/PduV family microcompartment system protein [Desemzia sp. C1]MCI3029288.1 EutP/PduV family microcompartment system protein [Desemzia sp. C1]
MKRIMLIGATGCGKTTLSQRINGKELKYNKTQAIQFESGLIDTPGEFVQHRGYYSALKVTSVEADVIAFVASVTEDKQIFAPLFNSYFTKPVIGILTKVDLAASDQDIKKAGDRLRLAGAKELFNVSSYTDEGIEELVNYLND